MNLIGSALEQKTKTKKHWLAQDFLTKSIQSQTNCKIGANGINFIE